MVKKLTLQVVDANDDTYDKEFKIAVVKGYGKSLICPDCNSKLLSRGGCMNGHIAYTIIAEEDTLDLLL